MNIRKIYVVGLSASAIGGNQHMQMKIARKWQLAITVTEQVRHVEWRSCRELLPGFVKLGSLCFPSFKD